MFYFENLRVYQEALAIVTELYAVSKTFPKDELFGLTNQLRRAVVSIALNIAEGSSRTKKDFRHFLDLVRGSCFECIAILTIAKNNNYVSEDQYQRCYEKITKLTRMIHALKNSISLSP